MSDLFGPGVFVGVILTVTTTFLLMWNAGSYPEEMKAAEKLCENNGGVEKLYLLDSVLCKNKAQFESKQLREAIQK